MALASITLLCSKADVERVLSVLGVQLRLDDNNDGATDADEDLRMNDALIQASETCYYYLYQKYTPNAISRSNLVNRWAADLAAYVLCGDRSDPAPESV